MISYLMIDIETSYYFVCTMYGLYYAGQEFTYGDQRIRVVGFV